MKTSHSRRPELRRSSSLLLRLLLVAVAASTHGCKSGERAASGETKQAPIASTTKVSPSMNVVLIVIDTLGERHLGLNNPELKTSPHLRAFAEQGTVFRNARSTAPWTKPSLSSIFTSLFPTESGLFELDLRLPQQVDTLAERLKEHGYATAGVVSHTLIKAGSGFEQGFDTYDLAKFKGNVHDAIVADSVTTLAKEKLEQLTAKEEPFFLFLHYFDPHFNYQHHEQYDRSSWYDGWLHPGIGFRTLLSNVKKLTAEDAKFLVDLHHEEIEYTDHFVQQVLEELKHRKLDGNTLIVLTADHGEEFLEHGSVGHTSTLYDELLHVPLVFWAPDKIRPQVTESPVTSLDIVPTIFDILGIPTDPSFRGKSLRPLLEGDPQDLSQRTIFSEVDYTRRRKKAFKISAVRDGKKLILDKKSGEYELYDVANDPLETKNLSGSAELAGIESRLKQDIEWFRKEIQSREHVAPDKIEHTPEEIEQLKSLGYL